MRATFDNKLAVESENGQKKIIFRHSLRCRIDAWFEQSWETKQGWVFRVKAQNEEVVKEFRKDLFMQSLEYIEHRAEKKITDLSFNELMVMAQAVEIKAFAPISV